MAESTKRRRCFRYVGNHLDTMFLLITNMVMLRETHNRRKDFDQGSNRQQVDLEKKKTHLLIVSNGKPNFWEEQRR